MLVARGARALDESDGDFMSPGLHLQRNVRETLHDRFPRRSAAAIDEREVLLAADVAPPFLVAVDQHHERVPCLERARIESRAEVRDGEPVLAVRRERVRRFHAAARAERHPVDVAFLVGHRLREECRRDLRSRLADREMRDRARGVDVLLDERRRDAERRRDVREALDLDLGRQVVGRIDVDVEQLLHRVRVLGAVEPLCGNVADLRVVFRVRVDGRLERRDQRVGVGRFWLRIAGRRHQVSAKLTDGGFEDFGVLGDGLQGDALERHVAGEVVLVVAIRAVRPE